MRQNLKSLRAREQNMFEWRQEPCQFRDITDKVSLPEVTRNWTKPLRLKRKHTRKNRHASGLNENGSKIPTLRSIDRFDKFSFLTNQQQPHVKRAKPDPDGALTRCSEVTLACHATQTVYKPLFHFEAKLNNKSLIRRLSV